MSGRWTEPPEWVPTYPGELQALADVEAAGWTVWWHNCGFGHATDATAIHPTNPASPMRLMAHEYPGRDHRWWWRPMVQIPHEPLTDLTKPGGVSPNRIRTYYPLELRRMAEQETA